MHCYRRRCLIRDKGSLQCTRHGGFSDSQADAVPHALLHSLLHNQVLHKQVVLLTVVSEDSPRVSADKRFEVEAYGEGFFRGILHFGLIKAPDAPRSTPRL